MEKTQADTNIKRGVRHKIGRATYEVWMYGSENAREKVIQKLYRIIMNDRKALKTLDF